MCKFNVTTMILILRQVRQEKELDPTTYYYLVEDLQTDYEYDFWVKASTIAGQGESSRIATEIPMSRGNILL